MLEKIYRSGSGPAKAPQPVWERQTSQGSSGPSATNEKESSARELRCFSASSVESGKLCVGEGADSELDADATDVTLWQMQRARSLLFANSSEMGAKQGRRKRFWAKVKRGVKKVVVSAGRVFAGEFMLPSKIASHADIETARAALVDGCLVDKKEPQPADLGESLGHLMAPALPDGPLAKITSTVERVEEWLVDAEHDPTIMWLDAIDPDADWKEAEEERGSPTAEAQHIHSVYNNGVKKTVYRTKQPPVSRAELEQEWQRLLRKKALQQAKQWMGFDGQDEDDEETVWTESVDEEDLVYDEDKEYWARDEDDDEEWANWAEEFEPWDQADEEDPKKAFGLLMGELDKNTKKGGVRVLTLTAKSWFV